MGTRPGAIDPGVILYLFQSLGLSSQDVETILYKRCRVSAWVIPTNEELIVARHSGVLLELNDTRAGHERPRRPVLNAG